ncbi:MAG: CvpA family protein [Chloroflexi bacterium]|nr:CvpA family protein [Chloroflexota bacterium]
MNWIDLVILVVWGITAYWGYADGFLKVVVPFIFMAVGLALASRIGDTVGNVFSVFTDNENAQAIGGVILIFAVAFVLGGMVSGISRKVLGVIPFFGLADKLGGMVVGLMVGFLLLSGILTGIQKFPFRDLDKTVDDSALGAFLADQFDTVIRGVGLIPGDWDEEFNKLKN